MAPADAEFFARVDQAERVAAFIERMAAEHPEARPTDADLAAPLVALFGADDPEPDPPANVVPFRSRRPFDRAAHCQAIAAGGGARTVALYGAQHMRTIGKAGARATIQAHGVGYWRGIVEAKGWAGPRTPDLAADLALGEYLADAA